MNRIKLATAATTGLLLLLIVTAVLLTDALQNAAGEGSRVALVIGNAAYPDDPVPLAHPIKDARAIAEELKRSGFDVTIGEDLTKPKLRAAIDGFKAKIRSGAAALLFFSGYGIQSGKQSYLIPVDARIWTEGEVRRDGITIDSVVASMNDAGAAVKLVILDASRRNPFERRFRGFSGGLAALSGPTGTLAVYSAAPDQATTDTGDEHSLFVGELLKGLRSPGLSAEAIFRNTRVGVSRASRNEQVPWVSCSLAEEFYFGRPPVSADLPPDRYRPSSIEPAVSPREAPGKPSQASQDDRLIETCNEAIERNPRDVDAYYKRAQARARLRQYALAVEDFGEVIRLSPQDVRAFNDRCWTRAMLDQLQAALSDCNEAIRLRPNFAEAFDSRGLVHLKLGQTNRAIADYDVALRANPKLASALYGRGKAKLRKGDVAGGNADIRTATAIDPGIEEDFAGYGVN